MSSGAGDETDKFDAQSGEAKSQLELLRQISRTQREGNDRLERGQNDLRDEVRRLAERVEFVTTRSAITVEKQDALASDVVDLRARVLKNEGDIGALKLAEEGRRTAAVAVEKATAPAQIGPIKQAFITAAVGLIVLVFGLGILVWAAKTILAFTPSAAMVDSPAAKGKL